jgi:ubiquitin carboxyl-terminal hydrolase 5/13
LTCFNGGCLDLERHHARTHYQKSGHPFTLNIRRRRKPSSRRVRADIVQNFHIEADIDQTEDEEPPAKMKKLAIIEERDEDKFEYVTVIKSWGEDRLNGREFPEASSDPLVVSLTESVMQSMSSSRQSEVKAWEDEITACEHTLTLEQFSTGHIPASGLAHCSKCDLKENLWLCLTCGSLGCGRQQFGGLGGNGHGLNHFEETQHPISVKLGTITPEGGAGTIYVASYDISPDNLLPQDIYCYSCDDSRFDPELTLHLAMFGIDVQAQTKTEKSMTELVCIHTFRLPANLFNIYSKSNITSSLIFHLREKMGKLWNPYLALGLLVYPTWATGEHQRLAFFSF